MFGNLQSPFVPCPLQPACACTRTHMHTHTPLQPLEMERISCLKVKGVFPASRQDPVHGRSLAPGPTNLQFSGPRWLFHNTLLFLERSRSYPFPSTSVSAQGLQPASRPGSGLGSQAAGTITPEVVRGEAVVFSPSDPRDTQVWWKGGGDGESHVRSPPTAWGPHTPFSS